MSKVVPYFIKVLLKFEESVQSPALPGYAWVSSASAHLFKCKLTSKDIKRISLLFPGLCALNHPPGLLSLILFPGPGLVPAVTLATDPGSRGRRICLTSSLSPSLCVRRRAEPAAGPPASANLLKCLMLLLRVVPVIYDSPL